MGLVMLSSGPDSAWKNFQHSLGFMSLQDHVKYFGNLIAYYLVFGVQPLHSFKLGHSTRLGLSEEGIEFIALGMTIQAPWERVVLRRDFFGQHNLIVRSPKVTEAQWLLFVVLARRFFLWLRGAEKIHLNPFTTCWQDSELRQDIEYYLEARASEPKSDLVSSA